MARFKSRAPHDIPPAEIHLYGQCLPNGHPYPIQRERHSDIPGHPRWYPAVRRYLEAADELASEG